MTDTFTYDANGNMTCRVEDGQVFVQVYYAGNRMSGATLVDGTCGSWEAVLAAWVFTYDGDGVLVAQEYWDGAITPDGEEGLMPPWILGLQPLP